MVGQIRSPMRALRVLVDCGAVAIVGLAVMSLLGDFGPETWTALAGAVCVAAQGAARRDVLTPPAGWPMVRGLAIAFAATAAVSLLGVTPEPHLVDAGLVLVCVGAVVSASLLLTRAQQRPPRVVMVGERADISRAAMRWSDGSVHVIGGVLASGETGHVQSIVGVPTIVGLHRVATWAVERRADLVVVAPSPGLARTQVRDLAASLGAAGVRMAIGEVLDEVAPHRLRIGRLGRSTMVGLDPPGLSAGAGSAKELIDRVLGALLLVLAAPVLALLMLAVRLDSPGPALFRQVRVGRHGRPFTMYKLRTMHVGAEQQVAVLRDRNDCDGLLFKVYDDPRTTRLGRILRRTSADELPQLWNVVTGEMSLVGPRPALPCEVAEYDDVERRRITVKPGMTGLWQVSGRSNLDWQTSVALDLDYIDNGRLYDDLLIGLRTLGAVVRSRGAY
jgi:exopolysaccharide biosynthesis polyprenyl glycosylphosphotransferase